MLLQGRRPDEKRIANKRRKAEAENKPFKVPERRPPLDDITAAASGIGEINIKLTGVSSPTAWGLYRRIPERAVSGR
jgi:hypothetical protein